MGNAEGTPRVATIDAFRAWLDAAPSGTMLNAAHLRTYLDAALPSQSAVPTPSVEPTPITWRERLWTAHQDTRLGVQETAEAFGRPESWVYRHTSAKSGLDRLPHRKLDGELVFIVGELRTWIREHEETIAASRPALSLHQTKGA